MIQPSPIRLFVNDKELPPCAPMMSGLMNWDWSPELNSETVDFFYALSACVGLHKSFPSDQVLRIASGFEDTLLDNQAYALTELKDWSKAEGLDMSPRAVYDQLFLILQSIKQQAITSPLCIFHATKEGSSDIREVCENIANLLTMMEKKLK